MATAVDEILDRLSKLDPEQRQLLVDGTLARISQTWVPNPGPQTEAYFSDADELGYGGEAGGGKSDLLMGLSLTKHLRSLVLRRTNKEAGKLAERYQDIVGHRVGLNTTRGTWTLPDGRQIDYGGCQNETDKQKYKGNPHDLIGFDEVVDFTESQYLFICTWNRTTMRGQRCRIVATFNPPTEPVGMWVMRRWGPWIDENHRNPARDGELRWYTSGPDGDEIEVEGPGPHLINGVEVRARSRTFIRARLSDNPDLMQTPDYQAQLYSLPTVLREAYAEGKFSAALRDRPHQMIPTSWVRMAIARRKANMRPGVPMCAIGVDASGGGSDPMTIASRYDGWFNDIEEIPGEQIPADRQGSYPAGLVIAHRRDRCVVTVDCGGGYGNGMYEHLKGNGVDTRAYKGSYESHARTKDGNIKFYNKRAEVYWRFREALDPDQRGGSCIMLGDDMELLADLTAPGFTVESSRGIKMETKERVVERLGRSTNRGDAVTIAWSEGPTHVTQGGEWFYADENGLPMAGSGRQSTAVMGRGQARHGPSGRR